MIRILFFCVVLISLTAIAEEHLWLTPGSVSYHARRDEHHNERNTGFGIEYDWNNRHALMAGEYDNSNDATTHYLLYRYTPWELWRVHLGGCIGVVDGYHSNNGSVLVGAALVAVTELRHVGVNFLLVPKDNDGGGWVIAAQLKLRF